MLRFHTAITSGLATLLVAPTMLLGDDELATLEKALADTSRALEALAGIEERVARGEPDVAALVRAATETPMLDERGRSDRLVELRNEVNLLQTELDALDSGALETPPLAQPLGVVAPPAGAGPGSPAPFVAATTGLNDEVRRALRDLGRPGPPPAGASEPARPSAGTKRAPQATEPREHAGYSADPLGHARVCIRAGRFADALALLEPLVSAEALYWKARCFERLDRLDDAETALEELIRRAPDCPEAERGRTDLDFVRWKRKFLKDLPEGVKRKEPR